MWKIWWVIVDSNHWPLPCHRSALTNWANHPNRLDCSEKDGKSNFSSLNWDINFLGYCPAPPLKGHWTGSKSAGSTYVVLRRAFILACFFFFRVLAFLVLAISGGIITTCSEPFRRDAMLFAIFVKFSTTWPSALTETIGCTESSSSKRYVVTLPSSPILITFLWLFNDTG